MSTTSESRAPIRSALVISDRSDEFRDLLDEGFPGLTIGYVTRLEDVASALAARQPDAVFSIRDSRFQGSEHRLAAHHPSVRWFQVGGSGYDHLKPLDPGPPVLTNTAGVLARYLAETVTGAMLALNGNLLGYAAQQRHRTWQPLSFRPLHGQTLLIVGLGAIGGRVADNAMALGMRVIATRRSGKPHPAVESMHPPAALAEIVGMADFVSLHLPLGPETTGLFDRAMLQAMKPGAFLINTARGAVVNEAALIEALAAGRLAGAYLDVFATEPLPQSSPLWHMPNVLLTPHAADNIADWPRRLAGAFADNLRRWQNGEPLLNEIAR